MSDSGAPPAGWLLDPDDPTLLRWWDGTGWSGFRRPRETPPPAPTAGDTPAPPSLTKATDAAPAPSPPSSPAEPRPEPRPEARPEAAAPYTPPLQPFSGSGPSYPPPVPTYPAPPVPPVAGPGFAGQWDSAVTAALAAVPEPDRSRRAEFFAAIRPRVVATARADEDLFELFAVTLHDVDPATGGAGAPTGPADLFVTAARALAVADPTRPGGAVVEIALADVVRVTPVGGGAVRVDLGHAPPVVLHSTRPGRRGDDLVTLLTTLTS